jgi:hypothetical protein
MPIQKKRVRKAAGKARKRPSVVRQAGKSFKKGFGEGLTAPAKLAKRAIGIGTAYYDPANALGLRPHANPLNITAKAGKAGKGAHPASTFRVKK